MDILTWLFDVGQNPLAPLILPTFALILLLSMLVVAKIIIELVILIVEAIEAERMKIRYGCPLEFVEEYVKKERNCAR